MFDLSGKRVLITGASGGIGKELSKSLLDLDANLILSGTDINRLQDLNDNLNKKCEVYKCDLSNVEDINHLLNFLDESKIFNQIYFSQNKIYSTMLFAPKEKNGKSALGQST